MISTREARADDATAIARCHIAAWHDSFKPQAAKEYLANLDFQNHVEKWTAKLELPNCYTIVAESDAQSLVGFVHGGPERTGRTDFRGEIYSVYVLKDFRGQGIGKRLFRCLIEALRNDKIEGLIVWVFADNECRACYAAWGGRLIDSGPITISGQQLVEVAYAWSSVSGPQY